jgi:hypothetical protein
MRASCLIVSLSSNSSNPGCSVRRTIRNSIHGNSPIRAKRRLIEDFKRSPLYEKMARDTVRWFEENRGLRLVAKDDLSEQLELARFLTIPRIEITDAAFVASLRNTPEGRLLVRRFPRYGLSPDNSSLVVSYGFVLAHSDCFRNIPMQAITEVDVSRVSEEEQSIFMGVRSRGSPPNSR